MYLLDPDRGHGRRLGLRRRGAYVRRRVLAWTRRHGRGLLNRTRGLVAETRTRTSFCWPSDDVLEARVRAAMGHTIRHPHQVCVTADAGWLEARGSVLPGETELLLAAIRRVPGVLGVDDHLDEHGWIY
jgi:hypothetical protein